MTDMITDLERRTKALQEMFDLRVSLRRMFDLGILTKEEHHAARVRLDQIIVDISE